MSAIGRIFLVLNLILSALFLGWAIQVLNQSEEWRGKYETSQTELETTKNQLMADADAISAQLNSEKSRSATLKNDRDGFEQQATTAANDLSSERSRYGTLQGEMTVVNQTVSNLTSQLESLEDAKDAAVSSARDAENARDDAIAERMAADTARMGVQDELDQANLMIADLETSLTSSEKMLSRANAQLATVIDEYNIEIGSILEQPLVEAAVLSVKSVDGIHLVALNVGSADAVKRGMTFQIWSGGRYKGEVRVDNVMPNMCSAQVTSLADASVPMTEGDNAATRL